MDAIGSFFCDIEVNNNTLYDFEICIELAILADFFKNSIEITQKSTVLTKHSVHTGHSQVLGYPAWGGKSKNNLENVSCILYTIYNYTYLQN